MIVYIFRHGAAVNVGQRGVERDADRMLSDEGRKKTAGAARGIAACDCAPERIFSSPLIRARETAEIAARELEMPDDIRVAEQLAPGTDLDRAMAWLGKLSHESIMLVGHLPSLAELASLMISDGPDSDIMLKKASLCRISFAGKVRQGEGTLEWLIQPSALRRLGK